MKLSIAAVALVLSAGLSARAASAADFWLQGRYSASMVKRSCDTYGGQFQILGGVRYRCDLADGSAVECTGSHECRAHIAGSSALPPSPRTLRGFLAGNAGGALEGPNLEKR